MRRLLKLTGYLTTLLLVAVLALAGRILLDDRPLVEDGGTPTPTERAWARHWLDVNRPDRMRPRGSTTLQLSEHEANLLAGLLLERIGRGRARIRLAEDRAEIAATLMLPRDLPGRYLDLELALTADGGRPRVSSVRVAGIPLPSGLIQALAEEALEAADRAQVLRELAITPERIRITYDWRPDLIERLGGGLVASEDLPLLLRYQTSLTQWAASRPRGRPIGLADALAHLLAEAGARRTSADPVKENRAALLALAAYVNGRRIRDPTDTASEASDMTPYIRYRPVLLRGRRDLSQHFMTSAALSLQGGDTLSSLIGWYKEMSDANGGSGFSFADLAANRAGIRLARLATDDPEEARRVQRLAAGGLREDDFMPRVGGLPEGMGQGRFDRAFGDSGGLGYRRLIGHIDRRIDARRLFRPEPG